MPQSDGKNRLKRIEFVIMGKSYKFNINPEEYIQEEPSRSTVTQTKGGAWVDDFGAGLPVITIRGSTGFQYGLGVSKFKELRNLVRQYYSSSSNKEFIFHNWTDDESWVVHTDPQGFRLLRNRNNPLLYMYDIRLICLRPATHPKTKDASGVGQTLGSAIPKAPNTTSWKEAIKPYIEGKIGTTPKLPPLKLPPLPLASIQEVKKLKVSSDGKVHDVSAVPATHPTDFSFTPKVSQLAVQALEQYKQSPAIAFPPLEDTLPAYIKNLEELHVPTNLTTAFRMILLELIAIWDQINTDEKKLPQLVSEEDLQRLISNTNWLAEELFKRPEVDYSISQSLRWLARAVQYIYNSELYKPTFAEKVGEINDALREAYSNS